MLTKSKLTPRKEQITQSLYYVRVKSGTPIEIHWSKNYFACIYRKKVICPFQGVNLLLVSTVHVHMYTCIIFSRLNGIPTCANKWLLTDLLRGEWGFQGYVISDEGAIENILFPHNYTHDLPHTAAAAVNAGQDSNFRLFLHDRKMIKYTIVFFRSGSDLVLSA